MKQFDHIIIGTGQALGTLLGHLLNSDDRIAVIEGHKVGGSCVNYGCTPTKALVASARAIHQARRGAEFGFEATPIVNFKRVMERMNEVRGASHDGLVDWILDEDQVTFYHGFAQFESNKVVSVNGDRLTAERIYINVGTRAATPPLEGLEDVPWLDSERLLDLRALPTHLLIVGGGYVGVELGQAFRRFGSEVTLVQRGQQLMPQEDREIAEEVCDMLNQEGIAVRLETEAQSVVQKGKEIEVALLENGRTEVVRCSHLLIATGRRANSDTLGLENTHIAVDQRGFIQVDHQCQTQVKGVFALGDVNGNGAFTHTAVHDAEVVVDHLRGGNRSQHDRIPIYALFSDPPLGRVGLTEKEAKRRGHHITKATLPMTAISRAKEMSETHGRATFIVDTDTDLLLGAAILGSAGDEVINMVAALMYRRTTYRAFRKMVFVHPTISELMPYAMDKLESES